MRNITRLFTNNKKYLSLQKDHQLEMYENSCSYQNALDLKRLTATPPQVKTEDCLGLGQCSADWASYRFHQSTFEQLKQSVEKAKAALQDRSNYLGSSAFR